MKRLALIMLSFSLCVAIATDAKARRKRKKKPRKPQERSLHLYDFGLGVALGAGTYSGITGAYMLDKNKYIQGQLGIQALQATFGLSADYIYEFFDIISKTTSPYAGGGVTVVYGADYASIISDAEGDLHFGFRLPLGVYTLLDEFPVQFYGEAVPGFLVLAKTVPVFGVNLGFRWFF